MDYEKVCVFVWVFVCVPVREYVWEREKECMCESVRVCTYVHSCAWWVERSQMAGGLALVWKRKWESWEHRMSLSTAELSISGVQTQQSGAMLKPRPGLGSRSLGPGCFRAWTASWWRNEVKAVARALCAPHMDVELKDTLQSWKEMDMHMWVTYLTNIREGTGGKRLQQQGLTEVANEGRLSFM